MINIYINVAMVGSVNQVLWDLLTRIKQSGLYDSANKIYLVFNGDRSLLSFNLVSEKYVIIDSNSDISKCEFPTLDIIHEHSKNEEFDILYLHTKGVTKPGVKTIEDWTNYLSYFNINKWSDRVKDLESNDTSGVNLGGNPDDINSHPSWWGYGKAPVHYSGNFWWSKSSHIKNLPSPYNWLPDSDCVRWRMMAEMWLCQLPNAKYHNAWHSNVNHYQQNYPKELYEKKIICGKVDIVVAKYKEDMSWVSNFDKSRLFIYDKSGEDNGFINLPNFGREAHTYLTHIIENYDNLSDYTCFLQGNPFDGEKGHLNKDADFIQNFNEDVEFYPLSYLLQCDLDGNPHHPKLEVREIIFDKFFNNYPEYLVFVVGAQFIVKKSAILRRKKEFYEDLLKEFDRTDIDNINTGGGGGTQGNKMPWVMERVWTYLFNKNFKTKYDV